MVYVRKTAHFTLYFLLGLAYIGLLKEFNLNDKKLLIYTIIFVFIYACSDEIHQMFVADRNAGIFDVILDTIGSFVGISFYSFIYKRRRKV